MQRIVANVGDVFDVGFIPVGLASAAAGKAEMYAPNFIEESREDLQRFVALQARKVEHRVKRRKNLRRQSED